MTLQLARRDPNGLANGNSPNPGEIGEKISAGATADSFTGTTANSFSDVTGMSITLTPGVWRLGYDVVGNIDSAVGSATAIVGMTIITDNSNNPIIDTETGISGRLNTGGNPFDYLQAPMSKSTVVTISSSTTYKVRIACNKSTTGGSGANGRMGVLATSATSGVTTNSVSVIYGIRIA